MLATLVAIATLQQTQVWVQAVPFPCSTATFVEAWACESSLIYQGVCNSDHSGLTLDAGSDWDGDSVEDVVLGGGSKVDLLGFVLRRDEYPNAATLYVRGTATDDYVPGACAGGNSDDVEVFPTQYPSVRLYGPQTSQSVHVPGSGQEPASLFYYMLADRFGWCVRFVGDVDPPQSGGSGTTDLAVGAPWHDASIGSSTVYDAGAVYLYLGGTPIVPAGGTAPASPSHLDIEAERTVDAGGLCSLIIQGETPGGLFGYSIAGETDFDGDGLLDLVIGAPSYAYQGEYDPTVANAPTEAAKLLQAWPNQDLNPGAVYVVFGSYLRDHLHPPGGAVVDRVIEIADLLLDPADAIRISASTPTERDRFGFSLDGIGDQDTNSSWGGDEIVVGAPQFLSDWQASSSTAAGPKTTSPDDDVDGGPGFVEVWSWDAANSSPVMRFRATGFEDANGAASSERARFGWSVTRLGTRTGAPTGFVVGSPGFDVGVAGSGQRFIDAGAAFAWELTPFASGGALSTAPAHTWRLTGSDSGDNFGWSVSSGGDFNADGVADVAIGARLVDVPLLDNPCTCSGGRFGDVGVICVVSSGGGCGAPADRMLANLIGEEARDRLGFGCVFGGDLVGGPGDDLVGGAPAWPATAGTAAPFVAGNCTDNLTSGQAELGRAYRFDHTALAN